MSTEEQRMLSGKLYNVYGKDLAKKYAKKDHLLHQINFAEEGTDVQKLFRQLLG
ncbi:maltose acetyltransferase domain-containing protein [Lentilactobacillus buchneri]|nr:maltose acetyltransferase domain-containing protein [Lentilactobacillus buchneri]